MPAPLLRPDAGLDPALPGYADSVRAVLLGGALGDGLGHRAASGPDPRLLEQWAGGDLADTDPPVLRISAETQLALYTLDGLQEVIEWANDGQGADETACLWLAYLRWLRAQGQPHPAEAPRPLPRAIDDEQVLHAVRAPGSTVLQALRTGRMGEVERPLLPGAADSGTLARSAPFGLVPHVGWRTIAPLAVNGAALTHGHPEAQTSAAVHGFVVHAAVQARLQGARRPIAAAVAAARQTAEHLTRPAAETMARIDDAVRAAAPGTRDVSPPAATPGTACPAPVALAVGLWGAMRAEAEAPAGTEPEGLFRRAVGLAVAHDGATGATGAVAGAVTAAALGTAALPAAWLERLDARGAVSAAADRWLREVGSPPGA